MSYRYHLITKIFKFLLITFTLNIYVSASVPIECYPFDSLERKLINETIVVTPKSIKNQRVSCVHTSCVGRCSVPVDKPPIGVPDKAFNTATYTGTRHYKLTVNNIDECITMEYYKFISQTCIYCKKPDKDYTPPQNWQPKPELYYLNECSGEEIGSIEQCTATNGATFDKRTNCCTEISCFIPPCDQNDTDYNPKKLAENERVTDEWTNEDANRTLACEKDNGTVQEKRTACQKKYRCVIKTDNSPKECPVPISSYVSPRDGVFHEDIELSGVAFGLHYASNEHNNSIAQGWMLSSHAYLSDTRLHLGSGAVYVVDVSRHEGGLTVVSHGSRELLFNSDGTLQSTRDLYTKEPTNTFTYDNMGKLVTLTDIYGQISTIERDASGKATAIVAPTGQRTLLSVDANGDLLEVQYEDTSSYAFEYERHLMTKETEPNGNAFLHFFDDTDKVVKVIDAEQGEWLFGSATQSTSGTHTITRASGDVVTYKNHFLENGILKTEKTLPTGDVIVYENAIDDSSSSTTTCGMKSTNVYKKVNGTLYKDPYTNRRVLESSTVTTPSGLTKMTHYTKAYTTSNGKVQSIQTTTDTNAKPFTNLRDYAAFKASSTTAENKTSSIDYDSHNQNIQSMKPYGLLETSYVYDAQGRVLESRTGERVTRYSYDSRGNLESTTNPLNQTTTYSYDDRDRFISTTYADGHTMHYSYDANGNMTRLTTPTPSDHTFGYNDVNKRTNYDSPLGSSTTYMYDAQRRVTQVTKPSGASIETNYVNGRIESMVTPEGATSYTYACQSNVSSITKGSESFNFTYDGTLLTRMTQAGLLSQTIDYSYNNDFLVSSMTYAGASINNVYNNDGELSHTGNFNIVRSLNGTLKQTLSDGVYTQDTGFNGYGEIHTQSDGTVSLTLERNNNGQITKKEETLNGTAKIYSYSYDDRARLTAVKQESSTSHEDAEESTVVKWKVYDNTPIGASISSVYDDDTQSNVIVLNGSGRSNGYILGKQSGTDAWGSTDTNLTWRMKYSENYTIYISVQTTKGHRYLYYDQRENALGLASHGGYVHHGLGNQSINGTWQTLTRDLQADLQEFEPHNSIITVNAFLIRGSGRVDDITLHDRKTVETYTYDANGNRATATVNGINNSASYTLDDQLVVYGNNTYRYNDDGYLEEKVTPSGTTTYSYGTLGELKKVSITKAHSNKWRVYDNTPTGAKTGTVYDTDKQSNVITLEGSGRSNGYILGNQSGAGSWGSTDATVTWSMKYSENYTVYISAQTTKGHRYFYYDQRKNNLGLHSNGRYIHHGLSSHSNSNTWKTYTRDLRADLKEFEYDNSIISVNAFLVRGSGLIDDVYCGGIREDAEQLQTQTITYQQNALNQRVAKLVDGVVVEKYLWADLTTLLAIYDKDDNLKQRFAYANGRMPVAMTNNGQKYYLHYDQVGSLRAVSDAQQHIVKEIVYDTYGNILSDSNPTLSVPFGFAGGLYDADTKLTRFGYRDYDAYTGKWTAKDPIGFGGGDSNLYGYVLGDPVGGFDPSGLFSEVIEVPIAIGITVGELVTAGVATLASLISGDTRDDASSKVSPITPNKRRGLWTCAVVACCNDNIPNNCPKEKNQKCKQAVKSHKNRKIAEQKAETKAKERLACQAKHVSVTCTGPQGQPWRR